MAQRVGRGIALIFHGRGTRMGWVVRSTPRPHFSLRKGPVPILQETGWAPGPVWTGGKSRPHRDSIPDRPARNQSLYRLSYPAHKFMTIPRWILLGMWNFSDKSYGENQNTHFTFNIFSPRKWCCLRDNVVKKLHSQTGHRWQYNRAYALCMPDKKGMNTGTPAEYLMFIANPR